MARVRLTTKVAGEIDGDVYTMNTPEREDRKDKYTNGNPSAWGEDVATNMHELHQRDEDTRDKETHHPSNGVAKDAAEAIKVARELEQKAVKCIVAAQRMLPGAADEMIEAQAADLMELPNIALNATLERQERLAHTIITAAEDTAKDLEDEEKTAAKKDEDLEDAEKTAAKKDEDLEDAEKTAAKKDKKEDEDAEDSKEDEDAEDSKEEKEDEDAEDSKEEKEDEDEDKGETKEASILDAIFSSVQASDSKKGASSLSGMVKKQASTDDALSSLWGSTPDVNHLFQ